MGVRNPATVAVTAAAIVVVEHNLLASVCLHHESKDQRDWVLVSQSEHAYTLSGVVVGDCPQLPLSMWLSLTHAGN